LVCTILIIKKTKLNNHPLLFKILAIIYLQPFFFLGLQFLCGLHFFKDLQLLAGLQVLSAFLGLQEQLFLLHIKSTSLVIN